MAIAIEQGVPIPERTRRVNKRPRYPFADMRRGDSFALSAKTEPQKDKLQSRLSASAAYHSSGTSKRFTVRRLDDEVRCWRVQ